MHALRTRLRFDRNELAGSFGDIGTDLPLIAGMILAVGLDSASVFILFGAMQLLTGLLYGLPMPVQPLKAMAVLAIAGGISADVLHGAGLAIGAIMLVLSLSGALTALARIIPLCVTRGLQAGLGLSLASLALRTYVPSDGARGWVLAAAAAGIMLALWGNRRYPAGLFVIALGAVYALAVTVDPSAVVEGAGLALPAVRAPSWDGILTGLVVLALPQLPLSLANSVIATRQACEDLFAERKISVRGIGLTYAAMNLVIPFFGGVPVCHGCGGLAGHHAFGARTGGSVVLYGSLYLVIGLVFSGSFEHLIGIFPKPVLGVVLLFEALTLLRLLRDQAGQPREFTIAILTAAIAFLVPQGYLVGLVVGCLLHHRPRWFPLG